MGRFVDLTGERFGRLTVIGRDKDYISPKGQKKAQWLCVCDCNKDKIISVVGGSLSRGFTQSCGCIAKEKSIKASKKYNEYDLTKSHGIGYTSEGSEFYFDIADYDKIKNIYWFTDNAGYIAGWNKGKITRLHRVVSDDPQGMDVDHINHDLKDNRKSNLRICTHHQNSMNQKIRKNNKSGVTGVNFSKAANKWRAYINYNREQIYLGCFDCREDAIQARQVAEQKYFKEFANKIGGMS